MSKELQGKLMCITPQECGEENPSSAWKLRRPVRVIYDEMSAGRIHFMRLLFPFQRMSTLPTNWYPSGMDIMAGGGSTTIPGHMQTAAKRLVVLMGMHLENSIMLQSDPNCPESVKLMGRRLKHYLTKTT